MKWVKVSDKPPEEGFGTGIGNSSVHFKTYLGNRISYSSWWLTSNDTITFNQEAPRGSNMLSRDSVYWLDESAEQYLLELPVFGSWDDVQELAEADIHLDHQLVNPLLQWLRDKYPHGFKVGTRYIYK